MNEGNKNNIRRLKEEADIAAVVSYLGIQMGKRIGAAQFVLCPNPDHNDNHPTNAYYRDGWNTIYCNTCSKNFGAIDVIMMVRGCSYGEACDILWEIEGRPDWYYAKRTEKHKETFSISLSELGFLGIELPGTAYLPVRETNCMELKKDELRDGHQYRYQSGRYTLVRPERLIWTDFFTPKSMARLVVSRCRAMEKELNRIEHDLCTSGIFIQQRERLGELYSRAAKYENKGEIR